MATNTHSTPASAQQPGLSALRPNRRAFLSAAAMAPVALAIPATAFATTHSSAWDAAVQRVNETKGTCDVFAAAKLNPTNDAFDAGLISYDQLRVVESQATEIASDHSDAVNAMTLVPAPTLAALHWKIATAEADYLFDGEDVSRAAIKTVIADLARLGGLA